jgi:hypothetical protein
VGLQHALRRKHDPQIRGREDQAIRPRAGASTSGYSAATSANELIARTQSAHDTRRRILDAAKALFGRKGIDAVSRDVYRMLVIEGRWTPDRYQQWLSQTLVEALLRA